MLFSLSFILFCIKFPFLFTITNRRDNMKKIAAFSVIVMIVLVLVGCNNKLMDTPTKRVEMYLSRFQTLDNAVLEDLDRVVAEEENFQAEHREAYKKLMKKQYQGLVYHVKDEVVNGDSAVVTVEIEVTDFSKTMAEAETYRQQHPEEFQDDQGMEDAYKYTTYRLEKMKNAKERVKYTLELMVNKQDDKWVLSPITDSDFSKIHGVYQY